MDFESILKKENISIEDLMQFQEIYDERFVDKKFSGSDEKVRHTSLHVAKLSGRLADYCEKREHGESVSPEEIQKKVIPDLLVYCFWLAREFSINPTKAYFERMVGNIKRLYADKSSNEELQNLKNLLNRKF